MSEIDRHGQDREKNQRDFDKACIAIIQYLKGKPGSAKNFAQRMRLGADDPDFCKMVDTASEKRDPGFFRKLADGFERLGADSGRPLDGPMFMILAYFSWMIPFETTQPIALPGYVLLVMSGIPPTKQQMRTLTERFWAVDRLIERKQIPDCSPGERQSPEVENQIKREINALPKDAKFWNRCFKCTGLNYLETAPTGPKSENSFWTNSR
jgi:hypothetical protein